MSTLDGTPPCDEDLAVGSDDVEGTDAGRERDVPRRVGVVVAPRHAVALALGDEPVAVGDPAPRRVGDRENVVGAVGDVGEAELLEHVGADAVRAEHDVVRPARRSAVADRIVHVAARVVGDRARQRTVEPDAMHDQPVVPGQRFESLAGGGVRRSLGDVDVHADAEVGRQAGGRRQRVVGARERGVHADHPASTGANEALVLGEPTPGAVGAVPVGDAVRARRPARRPRRTPRRSRRGCPRSRWGSRCGRRCRSCRTAAPPGRRAGRTPGACRGRGRRRAATRSARGSGRSRSASCGGAGMPRASVEYRWWCEHTSPPVTAPMAAAYDRSAGPSRASVGSRRRRLAYCPRHGHRSRPRPTSRRPGSVDTASRSNRSDGEAVFRIDSFALTANNVTYGAVGDLVGYWNFFPASEDGWGRIPVWGFADVAASRGRGHRRRRPLLRLLADVDRTRCVRPASISPAGFTDVTPHRAALPPIYNRYAKTPARSPTSTPRR